MTMRFILALLKNFWPKTKKISRMDLEIWEFGHLEIWESIDDLDKWYVIQAEGGSRSYIEQLFFIKLFNFFSKSTTFLSSLHGLLDQNTPN